MTYPAPDKIPYDEWFHDPPHPYDNWPMATDKEEKKEEEITMHEKMYQIATARNNPFHVGGSENAQSDVDYIKKHSPWEGGGSQNWNTPKI